VQLFRVLEVRDASQQKSLSGLDNIAADSSAGFERLDRIDEFNQIGLKKDVTNELRRLLRDGERYFKTEYESHCQDDESQCPDHCRKLGLSDPKDPDFQEHCTHQHTLRCPQCDDITLCLQKMHQSDAHPVKGTTAAVSVVKESEKSLSVNKIVQFSSLHNFQ